MSEHTVRLVILGGGVLAASAREWCYDQILAEEGSAHTLSSLQLMTDKQLCLAVLDAWAGIARDKGLL